MTMPEIVRPPVVLTQLAIPRPAMLGIRLLYPSKLHRNSCGVAERLAPVWLLVIGIIFQPWQGAGSLSRGLTAAWDCLKTEGRTG